MKTRKLLRALALPIGLGTLLLAGCRPAQQQRPPGENSEPDAAAMPDESQQVSDAALGKQAEIVARGDLAHNGLEQLLIVNRMSRPLKTGGRPDNPASIFISRAAILEKNNGKWSEILRCDEHLKNPNGYLGGSSPVRVTGWRLEFRTDASKGLELEFTPAGVEAGEEGTGMGGPGGQTVIVRWNARAKRYQSLDASHEGYLSEAPTIETPQSILR